jgi:hypothetical protein
LRTDAFICYQRRPVSTFFRSPAPTALALAASVALAGCDAGATSAAIESASPRREPLLSLDPVTVGTIAVHVRFAGTPPPPERLEMSDDASCCKSGSEQVVRVVDVGPDGGLASAFVWVREGLESYAFDLPAEPVVLDQRGCAFLPRVLGVRAGQPLRILNGDDTLHDVHAIAEKNRPFNFGFPGAGSERTVVFRKPETMIALRCHVHDWMRAWLGVVDHPCFAVTGASGAVELRPVPPGEFEVAVWHEKLGTQSRRVTVSPSAASAVEFVFEGK